LVRPFAARVAVGSGRVAAILAISLCAGLPRFPGCLCV